ncbi:uncharacterized protein FOMMEDRAFT_73495 [Fomitiporia mediterranea MF3/22]|uniref:uncharacterized protein n=1 Tax=Fomitiporia mediterranea (strain MF3/22) TaxID=694068 RepID=UPI0004407DD9|nr:uncharacterized protein FOMMEDRAFT_73495 [Fomitiporia mediterranea MF3/22]EJD08064.1 hypothetical protein FOMMEDRAFT_73495 [Fomitiporia mediterranea MF3/22]
MSAYGVIVKEHCAIQLHSTAWKVRSKDVDAESRAIVMFHLTLSNAPSELVAYMHEDFADELERGDKYPQEPETGARLGREAFEAYFFAADVLVGIHTNILKEGYGVEVQEAITPEVLKGSRTWKDCVAGFYYVKPNYPGRSSHICNAGFVVPFSSRGQGFASVLARSYLHYAPRLGYQASVFNLVYVNNSANIHLKENLGFEKAGRIPHAGRLKRKDEQGEEYVDAWVFYKSFDTDVRN